MCNQSKALYKENCCGCGICEAICKKNAIQLSLNFEGFLYPVFDEQKCNSCGLCKNVCYCNINDKSLFDYNKGKKYFAYSKDKSSVLKSSSGAVAYEMSKYALENGYFVIGTCYDANQNKALTKIGESLADIDAFRGSKYIQAYSANAFKDALHSDNKYIIIGTPCQIYEMKKASEILKIEDKFIFIDFVCHGVPSYFVWSKYIKEKTIKYNLKDISSVNFRDKKNGWHQLIIKISASNKTIYSKARKKDSFYKIFDDGYMMSNSCYQCTINNGFGVSDIRIGDYWGKAFANNHFGVSRIIVATSNGQDFFDKIKDRLKFDETEEMFLPRNNQFFLKNCKNDKIRNIIISALKNNEGLDKIIRRYRKELPLKIRISKSMENLPTKIENLLKAIYRFVMKRCDKY